MSRFLNGLISYVGALDLINDMEYTGSSPPRAATHAATNRPLKWTPLMLRALLDYVDEEKGRESVFIKDRAAAVIELNRRMQADIPAHLYNKRSRDNLTNKIYEIAARYCVRGASVNMFLTRGLSVVVFERITAGVFSEEEVQTNAETRKAEREASNARTKERKQQRVSQAKRPMETESVLTDPSAASDFGQVMDLEDVIVCAKSSDKVAIGEALNDMANKIESCVNARLEGAGISAHRPTVFNFEAYGSRLCELLETVGGCDRMRLQERFMSIVNMQSQQRLDIATFVQAVIGAAVTLWALQTAPLNEAPGSMYDDLVSEWQLVAPVAARAVQERALRKHLRTRIIPAVPEKAKLMADKLNDALMPFLTPPMNQPGYSVVDDVAAVDDGDVNRMEDLNGDIFDTPYSRFTSPAWVLEWQSELTDIFSQALQLRVDTELMNGEHTLVFPSAGSRFKTKTMIDKRRGHPQSKTRASAVKDEGIRSQGRGQHSDGGTASGDLFSITIP